MECFGGEPDGEPCSRDGWIHLDGKQSCGLHADAVFGRRLTIEEVDRQKEERAREEKNRG